MFRQFIRSALLAGVFCLLIVLQTSPQQLTLYSRLLLLAEEGREKEVEEPLQAESDARYKKNVLALGGSSTWGAHLESREGAYPHLLGRLLGEPWQVHNLAIRATDASYPAQCIQTMTQERIGEDIDFDVIILEYSINGLDLMLLLLKRLRQRFPRAIIIYVHLWSLQYNTELVNEALSAEAVANKPRSRLVWKPKRHADEVARTAKIAVDAVSGHFYQFPIPDSPHVALGELWFARDRHHLAADGHAIVAADLASTLRNITNSAVSSQGRPEHDQGGTWGAGDRCYSWYETGNHSDIKLDRSTHFKPDKYAVDVAFRHPLTIEFHSNVTSMVPVMLSMMSYKPGVYPKSKVHVSTPGFENQTTALDPLHGNADVQIHHVTRSAHVGWVSSGLSRIMIDPIEEAEQPLRVTGIIMCGACRDLSADYPNQHDYAFYHLGNAVPRPSELHGQETHWQVVVPHSGVHLPNNFTGDTYRRQALVTY